MDIAELKILHEIAYSTWHRAKCLNYYTPDSISDLMLLLDGAMERLNWELTLSPIGVIEYNLSMAISVLDGRHSITNDNEDTAGKELFAEAKKYVCTALLLHKDAISDLILQKDNPNKS